MAVPKYISYVDTNPLKFHFCKIRFLILTVYLTNYGGLK